MPRALHFPLLLLGVLAGLLAMHGLGPHDDDHSDGHTPTVLALVATAEEHVDKDHHGQTAVEPAGLESQAGEQPDDEGGSGPGECLALLGLLLALAIGAVLAARSRKPIFILRGVRTQLVLRGRPPDPPCLHRLSIMRC